nr:MAG TPA: hypothetical protein [Caudoviricetes sp.]
MYAVQLHTNRIPIALHTYFTKMFIIVIGGSQ